MGCICAELQEVVWRGRYKGNINLISFPHLHAVSWGSHLCGSWYQIYAITYSSGSSTILLQPSAFEGGRWGHSLSHVWGHIALLVYIDGH